MRLGGNIDERGTQVPYNYTKLSSAILAADTASMTVDALIFTTGDVVTIGSEDITIASHATKTMDITRGTNSTTPAVHGAGQIVRLRTGTEILSVTFNGSTYFSGIWVSGENESIFRIKWNDDTDKYLPLYYLTPYQLNDFIPSPRYLPENGETLVVQAWSNGYGVCTAEYTC